MDESLNHIHQDTKSAQLIAVCRRSLKARLHRRFLWRSFSFRCMRLNGLTYECIRPSVQSYINQYIQLVNCKCFHFECFVVDHASKGNGRFVSSARTIKRGCIKTQIKVSSEYRIWRVCVAGRNEEVAKTRAKCTQRGIQTRKKTMNRQFYLQFVRLFTYLYKDLYIFKIE